MSIDSGELVEYSKRAQELGYTNDEMKNLTVLDLDTGIQNLEQFKQIASAEWDLNLSLLERIHKRKDEELTLLQLQQ